MQSLQWNKKSKKYDDGIIDCCKNDPELMMTFKLKDGKTEIFEYIKHFLYLPLRSP